MSLFIKVRDGTGGKESAKVAENHLCVAPASAPIFGLPQATRPLSFFLSTSGGTTEADQGDMRVDGSSTSQDFYIEAAQDDDRYIKTLNWQIVDASGTLANFGNLSALTNGCRLIYQDKFGEVQIGPDLTTKWLMMRLSGGNPAYGDGANAFRANNVSGTAEGYMINLDLAQMFGLPFGVKLAAGSSQRLIFRIRDDLSTGMTAMDCFALGITRLKP